MKVDVHFSSGKDDYETPPDLFATLHKRFNFTLDVCAVKRNAKCVDYFTPAMDGLTQPWSGMCWCNPPYSKSKKWIAKAWREMRAKRASTVMLLPARTDTKVFQDFIWNSITHRPHLGISLWFLKGRLRFVGAASSAPFPSMLVIFDRRRV